MKSIKSAQKALSNKKTQIILLSLFLTFTLNAYNLRQLSSKDGLSNSAILSICQDSDRFLWIGTADGLNVFDGADINIFKPNKQESKSLSGNLIEEVWEGEKGIIWINTNHGLNRYDKKNKEIKCYSEFEGKYYCTKTSANEIFTIHENNKINYYNKKEKQFISIPYPGINKSDIQRIFIDKKDILWIITNKGIIHNAKITFNKEIPSITRLDDFKHSCKIRYAFMEKTQIYLIDEEYNLFEMDASSRKKSLILNLKKEIEQRGIVSSIIKDNEDYLVAFQTNGLLRLQNTPESLIKYQVKEIEIYCGVFCLFKDEKQDIIWIGTDGQGVYMYTRNLFSMRSVTFEQLRYSIQKPVRALFLDKEKNLWIGTKDDGIFLIENYHIGEEINQNKGKRLTTSNSNLTNNSVYTFEKSRRNILWIGGDGPGLNYYSYKEKKIKKIASKTNKQILFIHAICEVSDSVLWMASVGAGIYKVTVGGTNDEPVIQSIKQITFQKGEMSSNYFFTVCQENDSTLWFGNRGYGLRRLNLKNETFEHVLFPKKDIRTINDILSIFKDSKGNLWVGTSYGIIKLLNYNASTRKIQFVNYNEIEGLPNNTIHGILEDSRGYLWFSTNGGLVRFDRKTEKFHIYNQKSGLKVFEFSDGAYLRDEYTGSLFFGGINGYVTITPDIYPKQNFTPQIFFTGLKIYEKEHNLNDLIHKKDGEEYLRLKYSQNFFSISFIALDYINGQNCKYSYNLENFNDLWIENGHSNVASFTNILPGKYILHVKCDNGDILTDVFSLPILILPPWYMSIWAYICYILLFVTCSYYAVQAVRKRYRRKREYMIEKVQQQKKEEIYESKLRFFTNITHEFSTPLTLIYGPCDRIISYEKSDNFIKKYAGLIMRNAERLNSLIQELIEFRRMESGYKSYEIECLDISDFATNIIESFTEMAETKKINYKTEIEPSLYWNTDKKCIQKILTNLLSNAFKYTPDEGEISLNIHRKDDQLEISVTNTGKGIKEEELPYIFDRYRVLENFEKQTQRGFFSRNGLGLAICHNMVKLLDGQITVKSIPNEKTEFNVQLPAKEIKNIPAEENEEAIIPPLQAEKAVLPATNLLEYNSTEKAKLTLFVIDDDPEICWFISEILSPQYHVISIEKPLSVFKYLETMEPKLIISDIMMPDIDGISLMKQIKADKRTAHIPFILLSAKNTQEEQTEGITAGAEAYIVKPFNVEYLQSIVGRLLQRQNDLKDYYRSAVSAYEFTGGKFIHKENKDFFERVIMIIDMNLANTDFSTEQLAKELGLSPRHLYRKLKEITEQTPANLIKEYRLSVVEKLLVTSQHSVDEIMYKTGFNNRGSFYKLFSQKFGMTPRRYRESKITEELK